MSNPKYSTCVLALLFCATPIAAQEDQTAKTRDRLTATLQKMFDPGLAPGIAIAVVQGSEVLYQRGFGFADVAAKRRTTPGTAFYIASSTKSFTGMATPRGSAPCLSASPPPPRSARYSSASHSRS